MTAPSGESRRSAAGGARAPRASYWLCRFAILRLLGFVYLFAFLSLALQVVALVGEDGLLPARSYLERVASHEGSRWAGFLALPSLFWIGISDAWLAGLAWTGFALSALLLAGFANALSMLALWALYLSFVHVGQLWYGYGWEIQLCETGFLAVFLCPLLDPRPFPRRPPPDLVIALFRWLIFRIMLGAGLIKLRGAECWRELTCLDFHFETQPIPGPLSRWFHFLPRWMLHGGVLFNHVAELVAPWFAFWPRIARHAAGLVMLGLQVVLILSGNLSFLNWLTIVPILACFDDSFWRRVLPRRIVARAERAALEAVPSKAMRWASIALAVLVAFLSIAPVKNLLSPGQRMNSSFDALELVNTYGAFGSVGETRLEIVFEGTAELELTPETRWRAYEFPGKPGDPLRRPPQLAPYQPRLDWQIWFAAMGRPENAPWVYHLVWKLLQADRATLALLADDPFGGERPLYVRALLYRYEYAPPGEHDGASWHRELLGTWLRATWAEDPALIRAMQHYGWSTARASR